ncbi:MAG: invasion associated locus B family protein [Pseudomonadota bacterium]
MTPRTRTTIRIALTAALALGVAAGTLMDLRLTPAQSQAEGVSTSTAPATTPAPTGEATGEATRAPIAARAPVAEEAPVRIAQADTAAIEPAGPDALTERYGVWTVRCAAGGAGCTAFQVLNNAESRQRVLQVTVFEKGGERVVRFLTPLGPDLARGLELSVDEADAVTVPFLTCYQRGCIAETALDTLLGQMLRAGDVMALRLIAAESGRGVRFEVSLDGVDRALDRLDNL